MQALGHRDDHDAAPPGLSDGVQEDRGYKTASRSVHFNNDTFETFRLANDDAHDVVIKVWSKPKHQDLSVDALVDCISGDKYNYYVNHINI